TETQCTHVAMEATGVYWKPVWHILSDGDFELVLANAAHIKNVPGRKSDVKDSDWISDLLAHGLIQPSFVPDGPTQEMRTLLRTRKQVVREKSSHVLRIQKTLEDANIKLDSVITDIRVKASKESLREALRGRVTKNHRFLLRLQLRQIDAIDAAIAEIDREVEASIAPFRTAVEQVSTVPGVKSLAAQTNFRDRPRHEPLSLQRPPDLLGMHLPAQRRECRQASFDADSQGLALAQDHPGAVRLGGDTNERLLSPSSILPHPRAAWREEGDLGRRGIDTYGHLSHAQGRDLLSRPRPGPL